MVEAQRDSVTWLSSSEFEDKVHYTKKFKMASPSPSPSPSPTKVKLEVEHGGGGDLLASNEDVGGGRDSNHCRDEISPRRKEEEKKRQKKGERLYRTLRLTAAVVLLFLNYFCAQYDKFVLSYFQDSFSRSLNLSSAAYGVLSGYATGIVFALLALPIAFVADYFPAARVWTLSVAAVWWSLCVIFQSLCQNFAQVLLARLGMGIGQSCVEAISVSLLSDLVAWRNVFLTSSCFYVGVYIGEAVSGQIATAFPADDNGWRIALRAIGITGIVLAVLLRLVVRDPTRQPSIVPVAAEFEHRDAAVAADTGSGTHTASGDSDMTGWEMRHKLRAAQMQIRETFAYVLRTRSLWILVVSAGFRQLGGNVFGYYMPSYLANTFPDQPNLLSRYGIIVGVVGSVTVLAGGALTSLLWSRTKLTPLYITGLGGMFSSVFVFLMIFSRDIAHGDQRQGIKVLYATMSLAYLTAEAWLGALNGFVALLLPPRYKTFGLAIWSTIQVLMYSAGPQIIGLALQNSDVGSPEYTKDTQVILAVMIPVCYWLAGIGFLFAVNPTRRDLAGQIRGSDLSSRFKVGAVILAAVLVAMVIALFVSSIVYATK